MTENQLNKLKSRLLNIQTQLRGASILLSKGEPFINSKIQDANKLVEDALKMCETVKTVEIQENVSKKKRKKSGFSYLVPHEVIVYSDKTPTYNLKCRNYSEIRSKDNKVLERTCEIGMDLCYCSKKCAYATNNVCSLR